jgi:hypothetical protein
MNSMTLEEKNAIGNQRLFSYVVFLATILAVSFPLFSASLTSGHDLHFHFLRFIGIKEGLLSGNFPVRIYDSFYNGYGYGASFFYPDLFLYPFAGLAALGVSEIFSFNIFFLATNIATYLVAAYSFRGLLKNNIAAIVGAVLYTAAPYHIHLLYTRKAVGEIVAYIFIPLLIYALYNLLRENFTKPLLLVVCMTSLVYSHLISALLCACICLIAGLIGIKTFIRKPRLLLKLGLCIAACVALTAAFWIPMLEQLSHAQFLLGDAEKYLPADHTVSLKEMFFGKEETGFGLTLIPFLFLRLFFLKEKTEKRLLRIVDVSSIAGFLCLFLSGTLFPWNWLPEVASILQFPWRLYTYAVFFFTLAICGLVILLLRSEKLQRYTSPFVIGITVLQMFACAILVLNTVFFSPLNDIWKSGERNVYANNGNEYLESDMNPLSIEKLTSDVYARADDGTILPSGRGAGIFSVELTRESKSIRVPLLYYYGYTAEYSSADNAAVTLPISREKETQVAEIDTSSVEPGGTITVEYKETRLQRLSFYTSLVAAVLLILYLLISFLKKRRASRADLPNGK